MNLREMREKAKISIADASKALGISYEYLTKLETNKRKPSLKLMKKLSELYKVKPEKIFLAAFRTVCSEDIIP